MSKPNSIVKNTIILYIRMMVLMFISLYTVRVVVETLGIVDFGLYNVVAGVVTSFSFLSGTLATASQRFFSFEIGAKSTGNLRNVFSQTLVVYIILALVIFIVSESLGLWFMNAKLVIPADRIVASNWVYQLAVLSFVVSMFKVPYDALIISHERMGVYAYLSIIECVLKLLLVFLLELTNYDKLILYAALNLFITVIVFFVIKIYCNRVYRESHFHWVWDFSLVKRISSYSGWNLFGSLASVGNNQGISILLNLFFGPSINASRAISLQVNSTVNSFVQNFMLASRPKIVKDYAKGEYESMRQLIINSSKYSYYLLFIISFPLFMEIPFLLKLWLKDVPEYTVVFTRIMLVISLIDSLSYSLMAGAQATGRIRAYQIIIGGLMLLNLPICFLLLRMGLSPQDIFVCSAVNSVICFICRLFFLRRLIDLSIFQFCKEVVLNAILITLFLIVVIYFLNDYIINYSHLARLVVVTIVVFGCSFLFITTIGMSRDEKRSLFSFIRTKFK